MMIDDDMEAGSLGPYHDRPRTFRNMRTKPYTPLIFRILLGINVCVLFILLLLGFGATFYMGASTSPIIVIVISIRILSFLVSIYLIKWVLAKDEGPLEMVQVTLFPMLNFLCPAPTNILDLYSLLLNSSLHFGDDSDRKMALKFERVKYWLSVGAQPSEAVERLLLRAGLLPPPPIVAAGGPRGTSSVGTSKQEQPADANRDDDDSNHNDDEIEKTLAILIGLIAGVALIIVFLSLSKVCEKHKEMVVPCGDPNDPHYRKNAFGAGEDGLGKNTHSLKKVSDHIFVT
ncbi:hypothetical protein HN873_018695 [Arachis hypogaea]